MLAGNSMERLFLFFWQALMEYIPEILSQLIYRKQEKGIETASEDKEESESNGTVPTNMMWHSVDSLERRQNLHAYKKPKSLGKSSPLQTIEELIYSNKINVIGL